MLDQTRPFRCYRLNFFPYPRHTVAMLTCTDWRGRTESDRRVNTWDIRTSSDDLHHLTEHRAVELLLRYLLDQLDPPEGDPLAEPSGSPEGDDRGEQLPLSWPHGPA